MGLRMFKFKKEWKGVDSVYLNQKQVKEKGYKRKKKMKKEMHYSY